MSTTALRFGGGWTPALDPPRRGWSPPAVCAVLLWAGLGAGWKGCGLGGAAGRQAGRQARHDLLSGMQSNWWGKRRAFLLARPVCCLLCRHPELRGGVGCEPCCRKGGSGDPTALLCACSPLALGMMQGGRAASSGEGVRAGTRPIPAAGSRGGIWGSFCFGCICAGSSGGSRAVVTVG